MTSIEGILESSSGIARNKLNERSKILFHLSFCFDDSPLSSCTDRSCCLPSSADPRRFSLLSYKSRSSNSSKAENASGSSSVRKFARKQSRFKWLAKRGRPKWEHEASLERARSNSYTFLSDNKSR